MMSEIEIETARLIFEIEKELLMMKFREMIEKTLQLEKEIRGSEVEISEQVDAYKPCQDIIYPAKKKVRFQ